MKLPEECSVLNTKKIFPVRHVNVHLEDTQKVYFNEEKFHEQVSDLWKANVLASFEL